jgi:hypothetical protein
MKSLASGIVWGLPTIYLAYRFREYRMMHHEAKKCRKPCKAYFGLPSRVGSVHRTMRAIARAEAKQEIAVLKIMDVFSGKSIAPQSKGRGWRIGARA